MASTVSVEDNSSWCLSSSNGATDEQLVHRNTAAATAFVAVHQGNQERTSITSIASR
jgi:hypothetical protein